MLIRKLFRTAWSYKSQFLSMIIMIAIGIVLYNLVIMSYIERRRELATLKVLGFRDKALKGAE